MLVERVLRKTAQELSEMGWNNSEIAKAISIMGENSNGVNVAMPAHFKEEAMHHAKCVCLYKLNLSQNSPRFKKEFKKAYRQYLTDAWLNSKGIEDSGDVKRGNPAGIEVDVFNKLEEAIKRKIIDNKQAIIKRAPTGIMFMGKDVWLQKCVEFMYMNMTGSENRTNPQDAEQLIKSIMTQYSAAVTSLGNTFLYAFANYNTKRKFSGVEIYDQTDVGGLESKSGGNIKPLEFKSNKKNNSEEKQKELRDVTYRQMTRQIYLFIFSTIVAGIGAIREEQINQIFSGVENICRRLWEQEKNNNISKYKGSESENPALGFLLRKKTRNQVMQAFYNSYSPGMMDRPKSKDGSLKASTRQQYLIRIHEKIKNFPEESKTMELDKI